MDIKLREVFGLGIIVVLDEGKIVHRNREYMGAAEWVSNKYGSSVLGQLYYEYKDNYDERRDMDDDPEETALLKMCRGF